MNWECPDDMDEIDRELIGAPQDDVAYRMWAIATHLRARIDVALAIIDRPPSAHIIGGYRLRAAIRRALTTDPE